MAKGFKTGGRKKGSLNKNTKSVKAALEECFHGIGGVDSFIAWAQKDENRAEFYKLWAKMLPAGLEVSGLEGLAELIRQGRDRAASR